MTAIIAVILGMLGASFGSYLLCVGERLAYKEKVVRQHSRCPSCNHILTLADLLPVFSWIFLKGRCRYCKSKIPARHLWTELLMALVFLFLYLQYGLSLAFLKGVVLSIFLFTASIEDLLVSRVDNLLWILLFAIWIVLLPFEADIAGQLVHLGILTILGALLLLGITFVEQKLHRHLIGGADIKALLLIWLYLPYWNMVLMFILSAVICTVIYVLLKEMIRKQKAIVQKTYPLVPVLSGAAILAYLVMPTTL